MFKVIKMSKEVYKEISGDIAPIQTKEGYTVIYNKFGDNCKVLYNTVVDRDKMIFDHHIFMLIKTNGEFSLQRYNHDDNMTKQIAVSRIEADIDDNIMSMNAIRSEIGMERIINYIGKDVFEKKKEIVMSILTATPIINIKHSRYYKPLGIVISCTNGDEDKLKVLYSRSGLVFEREMKEFLNKFRVELKG